MVSSRKDSPRAVRASGYFLWYTATSARSARLNFKNVAGVSNPVKPVPRGKGKAVPPAVRLVFASSRSVSMNVKIWSVLVTMGATCPSGRSTFSTAPLTSWESITWR